MIVNLTGGNQQVRASSPVLRYRGFSVRETSGTTTATVRIFDGTSAAGTVLDEIALGPGESAREYYPDGSLTASKGIYVQVTGQVTGSVRFD